MREAIIASNTDTASGAAAGECIAGNGNDTINFNIASVSGDGGASFTNDSKTGYTILPTYTLPTITKTVTIDGYSQPGSEANDAVAPNPLNGTLLIQVNGTNAGNSHAFQFIDNSDGSTLKGVVVNSFSQGDAVKILADDVKVQGNYIGTDPTGSVAHPNVVGVNAFVQDPASGHNALIGGLSPADRNLISGNTSGTTGTAGYPGTGWTIQGNYVGVAADGLTPLANSTDGGSGSFSIDDNQDVTVGGSQPGAINVIGESLGHGLAPDHTTNLLIEGNYIGLGYDGTTILGNTNSVGGTGAGFAISNVDHAVIKNNRVAGWKNAGIAINGGNSNITIEGNIVHDNVTSGIGVLGDNISVHDNTTYDNGGSNLTIFGFSAFGGPIDGVTVTANRIGLLPNGLPATHNGLGINISGDPANVMIGGVNAGDGNTISANTGEGIAISSFSVPAFDTTIAPESIAVIGNSIYGNKPASSGAFSSAGLGIDLFDSVDADDPPDGQPDLYNNISPTVNDTSDADTGPNGYLNFPVITSTSATAGKLNVNFDLDVDNTAPGYRVEFFASPSADPSGYGEGQIYLGSKDVSGSTTNGLASLNIPSTFSSNKYAITATTTEKDSSSDGFGSTSEFSAVLGDQTVLAAVATNSSNNTTNTSNNTSGGSLAQTGQNSRTVILILLFIVSSALTVLATKRKDIRFVK